MELRAQIHAVRGRLPRLAVQAADEAVQSARRPDPQTYAIGIKELWEVPAANHKPGLIEHTRRLAAGPRTYGGSFLYHFGEIWFPIGFVIGLDYQNP